MGACYSSTQLRNLSSPGKNNNKHSMDNYVNDNTTDKNSTPYTPRSLRNTVVTKYNNEPGTSSLASFITSASPAHSARSYADTCDQPDDTPLVTLLNAAMLKAIKSDATLRKIVQEMHVLKENLHFREVNGTRMYNETVDLERQLSLQLFDLMLHKGLLEHAERTMTAQNEQIRHLSNKLSTTLEQLHDTQDENRRLSLQLLDFTTINP